MPCVTHVRIARNPHSDDDALNALIGRLRDPADIPGPLVDAVDIELNDDRHWFDQNPRRTCRVRRTFPNEQREFELAGGKPCPPGGRRFTVVRQLEPGVRLRTPIFAGRKFMPPVTEMGSLRTLRLVLDLMEKGPPS